MIRRAEKGDADRLAELWMALLESQSKVDERFGPSEDALARWRNDYPGWLRGEARRIFVAVEDDDVQGFVTAERWSALPIYRDVPEVYIDELFVVPEYRRRGLGRDLVGAVTEWARSVGARRLRAGTLHQNPHARPFWEKVGARPFTVTYTMDVDASENPFEKRSRLGFQS